MSKPSCLVVEDSPYVAENLATIAREAGYAIAGIVACEDRGIEACERERVDVALVDLQLAQGTGFGVIRHLRPKGAAHVATVIVITNHAVPALKVAAFEAGADYFLDKSKDFGALARILRELADLRTAAQC